jgi:hypothetical protein
MIDGGHEQTVLFEVSTPLGFRVRVTRSYGELITTIKHPVMAGRELIVQDTLKAPVQIRLSRSEGSVYLFYRHERVDRWICAVVKRLNGEGFLITTYPAEAIKEGERIWPK